jgi:CcmD family protein
MTDAGFVVAAYAVIMGGLGLYTLTLWRRLVSARRELDRDDEVR